ncbi:HsdR family type I site-specific deoxyribonuclease [bacterium]|nr:HsdR family type I site-specific deoxyribonuclease [bacterium]
MPYTEKGTVEDFIVEELKKLRWRYAEPDEINQLREDNLSEPILTRSLKNAVQRLNPKFSFTESDLSYILSYLRNLPANIVGIKSFLDILKNGLLVPLEREKKEQVVKLLDFENIQNNEFIFTRQFTLEDLTGSIRADVLLFINGIPLVLIECKSPTREEVGWLDAYRQIKRYEYTTPELFKYVQFSIATDGIKTLYFPNSFAEESEEKDLLSEWKDPYPFEPTQFKDDYLKITIYGMLSPFNLLDLLENFLFIRQKEDRVSKVLARYQQFRASNKIFRRVIDTLTGKDDKKFGLIWHWQGSGKTYTMAFSAWKLYHSPEAERPSIFVMVDRKDLEEQIEKDFAFIGIPIERIGSIRELIETLKWGSEGKRGIFLVTVEKFSPKEFLELENIGESLKIERENVIILADEVHRTQYGKFRTLWSSIFKNAFVFGFTGTPLSKSDRNTFQKFCPPDELYLDRYSMADSLRDGFTVPLSYQARLPDYHLKLEELEQFARFEEEEIETLSPEEKKELRKKVKVIKTLAKKPERIKAIAEDIVSHFREIVEPTGLKAMLVTIDREACVCYKKEIDKLLPSEESEIVMTFNPNDNELIRDYFLKFTKEYSTTDIKQIHERIINNFKIRENPKILIVTDMLITGFDAPILWCMYLDKPLKEHRLLQAIARTNRPYSTKGFGLICDYIGVLEELQKALCQFEASDSAELKTVIRDLTQEKKDFERLLNEILKIFEGIKKEDTWESLQSALEKLVTLEEGKIFEEKMRKLMKCYEMLGGEDFLLPYLRDYDWLVKVFIAYNKKFRRASLDELKIEELSRKTIQKIQRTMDVDEIERAFPTLEINQEFIKHLQSQVQKNLGSAIDAITSMQKDVRTQLASHPSSSFLLNLSKEIEATYEALRLKRLRVEEAYERILEFAKQISDWKQEEKEIGKDKHPIFEAIKSRLPQVEKEKVLDFVNRLLSTLRDKKLLFKGWYLQKSVSVQVRIEVRIRLLSWLKDRAYDEELINGLHTAIMEALKEVGE